MDYDFSFICSDQLEKLDKRLYALKKTFIKEYIIALNVINNPDQNDHRNELKQEIDILLSDCAQKCSISFKQTFNKIQDVLRKYL
jgi:hypothetical protein